MELEELMMGMVELPILYNALFPASTNAPNSRSASERAIRASESFDKKEILAIHKEDGAKFTSWLQYVDTITASKEQERKEKLNGNMSHNQKGLLLKLRESVVEIPPRPPAPLGCLGAIRVSELHLDRQHYGRVLYGTFCAEAFKMTAVMTVLEEPSTGHVMKLAIYNAVPSAATLAEVQAHFPEGSRVAIKEPYFKRYKDQTVGLRVNNPGDVVFVESSNNASNERQNVQTVGTPSGTPDRKIDLHLQQSNLRTYDELRLEGNRAFSCGDWKAAMQFYTTSIRMVLNSTSSWKLDSTTSALCEPSQCHVNAISKTLASPPGSLTTEKKETVKHRMEDGNCKPVKPASKNSARKRSKKRGNGPSNCEQTLMDKIDKKAESALLAAYSNRSEACLRLHQYYEALVDAEDALKIDSTHVKSMFRKGRALHHLQQYSKAVQCLQAALAISPHDADLVKALKESLTGDLQSRLGVYDLSSYYLGNSSGPPPPCADFVGPVKVQMVESKYGRGSGQRGLVVSKSVKAGDLLLVSNPLAVARAEGVSIEFHLIPATRRMNDASQEDLVTQLYNFARVSPRVLNQLHSLYSGTSCERREPSMELFTPGMIGNASNLEPRADSLSVCKSTCCAAPPAQQPDITKIRHIVQWNAFDEHGYATERGRQRLRGFCSGIWLLPSFINHSCLPNVSRVHVGDAMMIYAARDLEAGDELCLPYFDILCPLPRRREKSLRGWGFICKCPRCMLEEQLYPEIKQVTDRFSRLEEDALPVAFQEQTAAGSVGVTKMSSSYVGDGFYRHAKQFLGLARDVESLLSTNVKLAQLTSQKKNWVRASYAIASIVGNSNVSTFDQKVDMDLKLYFLRSILDSLEEVFPGNPQTLSIATTLMDESRKQNGIKSQSLKDAEERVICICRCSFGNQKLPVLWSFVRALQEGKLEV